MHLLTRKTRTRVAQRESQQRTEQGIQEKRPGTNKHLMHPIFGISVHDIAGWIVKAEVADLKYGNLEQVAKELMR